MNDLLDDNGKVIGKFYKKLETTECTCKYKSSDGYIVDKDTRIVYKKV